ncbi:low temperature requirement protein A [Pseudonocardia sp. GCM10023141]|uniref:low temperature requirement protein A n=1 Tax=Pseudonocardia sp. GCM10023141 TaxID=3252653 RepID=UPI0036237983
MSESPETVPAFRVPWRRSMVARDPGQSHRASTPLELLFDLCFVVAISQAAAQLAHGVEADHIGSALLGYAMVFFAIWWAWMNFTWFASAYDTDDVPYRLLTLVQMAGVLVLAAGVPAALTEYDFTVATIGYAIMRVPMVLQWLRAAREHPAGRACALRYAGGIAVVQVLWLVRLALPHPLDYIAFGVLVLAEIAVPVFAESRGATTWHPEHIAERYGLLTLIVLGECVLGTTIAFQSGITEAGLSIDLIMLAIGGLLLIFGLWWTYFLGGDDAGLVSMRVALTWGYGHYLVFAAIAALGAGLEVAVLASEHQAHLPLAVAGLAVAVPVAVFMIVISQLRQFTWPAGSLSHGLVTAMAVLVLGCGALAEVIGIGSAVLAMGVVLGALLAVYLRRAARR